MRALRRRELLALACTCAAAVAAAGGCGATRVGSAGLPPSSFDLPPPLTAGADGWWTAGAVACAGGVMRGAPPRPGAAVWCEQSGIRQGRFTAFHATGHPAEDGNYSDGKRDGVWMRWRDTGAPLERGAYRAGRRTGVWESWTRTDAASDQVADRWIEWTSAGDGEETATDEGVIRDETYLRTTELCVVGLPFPDCRVSLLEEVVFLRWSRGGATGPSSPLASGVWGAAFEGGLLVNLGEHHSAGLSGGPVEGPIAATVRARYRAWPVRYGYVDLGAGVALGDALAHPGPVAHALAGVPGLSLGVDVWRVDVGEGDETSALLAIRVDALVLAAAAVGAGLAGGR